MHWSRGAIIALAAATACSSATTVGRSAPQARQAAATATRPPTPVRSARPQPPPVRPPLDVGALDLSSDDVEAVARNIALVIDEAHHRPDPALADLVLHPDCPCHARVAGFAARLAAAGEREIDANYRVVRTQLISILETGEAVVRVVHEQGPVAIMDRRGRVRHEEGWPRQRTIYYLRRDAGRWRVVDMELEGVGDAE